MLKLFNPRFLYQSLFILIFLLVGLIRPSFALDAEPRQWSHLPMGLNYFGMAYAHTKADIFFDPALRLEDVEMELNTVAGKYIRSFPLLGKSTRIDITQAYQEGKWTGKLDGVPGSVSRKGWSDTIVRMAMNFYGAPPLTGKAYRTYRSNVKNGIILGTALQLRLPTGNYKKDKLINLGKNRYTIRPQLGISYTHSKWITEATGEVAFFTNNNEFFDGNKLEQKPLFIGQVHLIRNFSPGFWASLSLAYDYGGEKRINGIDKNDREQNVASKISFAYPINHASGIKISYIVTRTKESTGLDSETLAASASLAW